MATTWLHNHLGRHGQKYAKLEYSISTENVRAHDLQDPQSCWCEPRPMEFVEGEGWREIVADTAEDKEG